MKKYLLLFFLQITAFSFAQIEDAWVYFNDKPDTAFYLENPLEMLSQRALDRRNLQNIPLDEKDVPIAISYIEQITNSVGITVMAKSKWLNALHIRGTILDIQNLENLEFVDHVDFANKSLNNGNLERNANQQRASNVNKNLEALVTFGYGNSNIQIEMLNGHLLHEQDFTGTGKIIAVMDTGFVGVDVTSPFQRMQENNLILGGYDFVNSSTNFYGGGSHGTMVLSTMGGFVENQLVGTAPDAHYCLFVTEDINGENPVEESFWVEAAEMADSLGVDIINTSLGYFGYDNPDYSYTYEDINGTTSFISRGSEVAFSRGMICVTSGGNSGTTENPHIAVPADAEHTLAVGAVMPDESYATFSSIGPSFDGRVKPDVMAQGKNAVVSNAIGEIVTSDGTSFSGPITAGLVACLWQALPDKTNAEIIQLIKESANLYATPNAQFGYGIPDFDLIIQNALGANSFVENKFIVYPNPVENVLNLSFSKGFKTGEISIYNSLGQRVLLEKMNANLSHLSLEDLASGIYFYEIVSGDVSQKGKLIKK
ncbi:subtilisin family serine protease [Flavobacterium arsenatis]|uniref:Subtilisin family serine protease n=1 Tax=Flavobacterium arsenatis TaxID=1484332 RepID=A0ABU1TMS1_9FLAO|nr:S8 family serine peptidase [Flavobacterium arsenatis]MDR6967107.1 subtilisin family serine protease [Flavobacterium arsenatis]